MRVCLERLTSAHFLEKNCGYKNLIAITYYSVSHTSFLPNIKFNNLFSSDFYSKSLNEKTSSFYKDIPMLWIDIRRKPNNTTYILDEVIW